MRNIKLTVPSSSVHEMNNLVDTVCLIQGEDSVKLRDKFKMVDNASPKKILDLCMHLELNVEFRTKKKKTEIAVSLVVDNNFSLDDPGAKKEEASKKEAPNVSDSEDEDEDVPF